MGGTRKALTIITMVSLIFITSPRWVDATELSDLFNIGGAFLTHLGVHESGHYITARMGGADEVNLDFFTQEPNGFFLGLSTAKGIDPESTVSYKLAGEAASSYLFEVALTQYRYRPTSYNQSLLFFSGTDFLWYSLWSFYIHPTDSPAFDPVGISQETGISKHAIMGIALLQSTLNAYRVHSGSDTFLPYIALDQKYAELGIQITF